MCSPAALGMTAAGGQVASGAMGVYNGYQQAAMARRQSGILDTQATVYDMQARSFEGQAQFARAMGGYQAALEITRAGQAQQQSDLNQGEAAKARQQVVGAGKTAFAANGVLLEMRQDSATAMWEQDEAAGLAWEQGIIKQNADNEVFGYFANAEMARAQGRMQAAGYLSEAAAASLNAQSTRIQSGMMRRSGNAAIIQGYAGLIGSASSAAGSYAAITAKPTTAKAV